MLLSFPNLAACLLAQIETCAAYYRTRPHEEFRRHTISENVKARGLSKVVEDWLAKAQPAIPQYEREAKRQ